MRGATVKFAYLRFQRWDTRFWKQGVKELENLCRPKIGMAKLQNGYQGRRVFRRKCPEILVLVVLSVIQSPKIDYYINQILLFP
jgi:hypothetical protein